MLIILSTNGMKKNEEEPSRCSRKIASSVMDIIFGSIKYVVAMLSLWSWCQWNLWNLTPNIICHDAGSVRSLLWPSPHRVMALSSCTTLIRQQCSCWLCRGSHVFALCCGAVSTTLMFSRLYLKSKKKLSMPDNRVWVICQNIWTNICKQLTDTLNPFLLSNYTLAGTRGQIISPLK